MAKSPHLGRTPHIRSRSTHLHTSEALHICARPHICVTSCHTSANVEANRLAHLCTFACTRLDKCCQVCTRPKLCTLAHVRSSAHLHTSAPVEVRRPAPERCAPRRNAPTSWRPVEELQPPRLNAAPLVRSSRGTPPRWWQSLQMARPASSLQEPRTRRAYIYK